jgi:cytochrome c553
VAGGNIQANVGIVAVLLCMAACTEQREQGSQEAPVQFQRASADEVTHGKRVADVLGCMGCHGSDLTGEDWSEPGFGKLWTANLTRAVPHYTDEQLASVIKGGRRPDRELWEMPSHLFTHLTQDDMSALIAYLRSKAPTGPARPEPFFEEGARREMAAGTFTSSQAQVKAQGTLWPPDAGAEYALGRYLVRGTCAECHGLDLRGGQPHPKAKLRPDLRLAAAYDAEQFKRFMKTGLAAGDRELTMMSDVARGRYKHLTDAEVTAIHSYLKKVAETHP